MSTLTSDYLQNIYKKLKCKTQRQFALMLNVNENSMSQYLSGGRLPSLKTCRSIVKNLKLLGIKSSIDKVRSD